MHVIIEFNQSVRLFFKFSAKKCLINKKVIRKTKQDFLIIIVFLQGKYIFNNCRILRLYLKYFNKRIFSLL